MNPYTLFTVIVGTALTIAPARAGTISFYAGIDNLHTLSSGPYAGLANPNLGRLTLLLNHGDHFHAIGAYSYSGPSDTPVINPTSTNHRIPEISSGEPPLPLTPGSGLYSGKLVNKPGASEYSHIEFGSMNQLNGFPPGSPEEILFNSSGQRWNASLTGAELALELISLTPDLHVGAASDAKIFPALGSLYSIGSGTGFNFVPVFWTDANAPIGPYSVTMRLHDLRSSSVALPSGEFTFDFAVVPEPSTAILVGFGLLSAVALARRRSTV